MPIMIGIEKEVRDINNFQYLDLRISMLNCIYIALYIEAIINKAFNWKYNDGYHGYLHLHDVVASSNSQ